MTWLQDWRESAADRALLRAWRRGGAFDAAGAARAHAALGGDPPSVQWAGVLDRLALWLGVALCAAGLLCFVAANWEHLGKTTQLYGLQALLVVCCVAALRAGLSRLAGQALLWLSMLVLGGVLALIGQTYQTGADAWELFALWAALSLPWVVAGRHVALWLTWALLLQCALWAWIPLHVDSGADSDRMLALGVGLFDALLLAMWEVAGLRWPEFRTRAGRWLFTAMSSTLLALASILAVSDDGRDALRVRAVCVLAWLLTSAIAMALCLRGRRDMPALALWMFGVVTVCAATVHRLLRAESAALANLAAGVAVVVLAALAAVVLRRFAAKAAT